MRHCRVFATCCALLAISEGRGKSGRVTIRLGEPKPRFNKATSEAHWRLLPSGGASLSRLNAGQVVLEITKISADCWFRLPSEFTMVAALLNLDRVVFARIPISSPCHHS